MTQDKATPRTSKLSRTPVMPTTEKGYLKALRSWAKLSGELEGENAELRHDVARLHDSLTKEINERLRLEAALSKYRDAEKALPELEKDARRYRWLRGDTNDYSFLCKQGLCGEAMDSAIDAAIALEGGE